MIALSLVRVVERHSNDLAVELVAKLGASPLPANRRNLPAFERLVARQVGGRHREGLS